MSMPAPGLVAVTVALGGCLGPQVSDEVAPSGDILPAGSEVPSSDDDPVLDAQIAAADGVDGTILRISAFGDGAAIRGWDFGPAPGFAAPLFVVVRADADGVYAPIGHPTIIEAVPGDPGYSPFWAVIFVPVTAAYDGELLTSVAAVQEAEALGLVGAPIPQDLAVNCPAVANGVDLEVDVTGPPLPPPSRFYYQGQTIRYYDFGTMPITARVFLPEAPRYQLRREGGEPLSEVARQVDMTGDGDLADTNDVLAAIPAGVADAPRVRTIEVVVPAATASIDTSSDETVADLRDATQLFAPDPVAGTVIAVRPTDEVRNWPRQRQVGGL